MSLALDAKSYTMPEVALGDVVLWSHNPRSEAAPAMVTKVGQRAISLTVFPVDSRAGLPMDGVRHRTDPELAKVLSDSGCWRHTDTTLRLRELEAAALELTTK